MDTESSRKADLPPNASQKQTRPSQVGFRGRFWASGWTFFFRWPVFRVEASEFVPASLFLGPFLQSGVFVLCAGLVTSLPNPPPGLAAFLGFVGLSLWSGFFHDDGLADTADSLGVSKFDDSDATLDRIHAAMKDSRLGTFGVSALVLFWMFRFLGAFVWDLGVPALALVVLTSRTLAFALAWALGRFSRSANAARSGHLMRSVGTLPLLGLLGATVGAVAVTAHLWPSLSLSEWAVSAAATLGLGTFFLWTQTRRCRGLSGDLIGATVCICEILMIVLGRSFAA